MQNKKTMQTTNHILMVRPCRFAYNEQTAVNNAFQQKGDSQEAVAQQAIKEFDAFVQLLRDNGITVDVLQDTPEPPTPDSIFPNNCFSTHGDTLVLYPMFAPNRRIERTKLMPYLQQLHFEKVVDLTHWEAQGKYLEGTGSLVLDRHQHIAYVCLSPRTHEEVLKDWAEQMGYTYFAFNAEDEQGMSIYHTNVMMHLGQDMAMVCLEAVKDKEQRNTLKQMLEWHIRDVIEMTLKQVHSFVGNMLELSSNHGQLLVMSTTAYNVLMLKQLLRINRHVKMIHCDIPTIETAGGGSARCMMAEIIGEKEMIC